jgi:hypothetical protein
MIQTNKNIKILIPLATGALTVLKLERFANFETGRCNNLNMIELINF